MVSLTNSLPFDYEYSVPTFRHPSPSPFCDKNILTAIVTVMVVVYICGMHNKAVASTNALVPQAARVASAMLSKVVSSRKSYTGNPDDLPETTPGEVERCLSGGEEPVLVFIYAQWCGHCKTAKEPMKKAAKTLSNKGVRCKQLDAAKCTNEFLARCGCDGFPFFLVVRSDGTMTHCARHPAEASEFVDEVVTQATVGPKDKDGSTNFTSFAMFY